VTAEFLSVEDFRFLDLLTLEILPKLVRLPLILLERNAQTKQNQYQSTTHRKQNNLDWKSNGPPNIPIPENFQKRNFLVQHHLIFSTGKKMPILRTLR
jgi:hypothetical protein